MNGVHITPNNPTLGHIEQGSIGHIETAEAWLKAQGCTHARGPMGATTWTEYRAVVESDGRPPFLNEPTADARPWLELGYTPVAHYASAIADNASQAASAETRSAAMLDAGWTVRNLEMYDSFTSALTCFHRISQESFQEAFAYTPLPFESFLRMYAPIEPLVDPRMVLTAMAPNGTPAGFCFTIPDRLNPDDKTFIVKTLAVSPEYRRTGLGSWLTGLSHSTAHALGHTAGGIHALMWASSHSNAISKHAGAVFRKYALFEKAL